MEKRLCIAALVVAGLLSVAFLMDLIIGIPFGGMPTFLLVDIFGLIVGLLLLYSAYNALRDVM